MKYNFKKMTQPSALMIADDWHYEGFYSFYDAAADEEDYHELISEEMRDNNYFEADINGELVGFFTVNKDGNTIEIGLGLRPDLCGKKMGKSFLSEIEKYVLTIYQPERFRVAVADFNARAIKVYQSCNYSQTGSEVRFTNNNYYKFLILEKNIV